MVKVKKCAGKDAFQRMNYLFQVANAVACKNENFTKLASEYLKLMISVSKKTVQRIDIDVKRSLCKQCKTPQVPGVNCRVRVKKKQVKWVCSVCKKVKAFKVQNPKYAPWTSTEEAIVETLDYKLSDE